MIKPAFVENDELIERILNHFEERKQLEELGLCDLYPENNSIRINEKLFVKLFGRTEKEMYMEKYDRMKVIENGITFYTLVERQR